MRCPACGALNPSGAAWCGQCLTGFPATASTGTDASTPDTAPPDAAPPDAASPDGSTPDAASPDAASPDAVLPDVTAPGTEPPETARSGDVRTVAGEVEWRCPMCDGWNPLLRPSCVRCGGERHGFGAGVGRPSAAATTADPTLVVLTTVVWPGVGHLLAGRVGTGAARALLWALWGGGALWLIATGEGTAAARWAGATLAAGAAVLWVVSLVEVRRRAGPGGPRPLGGPPLLGGRGLGVLVAVVTTALLVGPLVVAGP